MISVKIVKQKEKAFHFFFFGFVSVCYQLFTEKTVVKRKKNERKVYFCKSVFVENIVAKGEILFQQFFLLLHVSIMSAAKNACCLQEETYILHFKVDKTLIYIQSTTHCGKSIGRSYLNISMHYKIAHLSKLKAFANDKSF